jgi:uncharacterized RDD family membrane protein YckC
MVYVGLGRRFVAWLIDLAVAGIGVVALGQYERSPGTFEASWLGWRFVAAWIMLPVLYYVLFEWLLGATPGKFLLGIRVRATNGGRIAFTQSLVRNLVRLIDALPYVIPYLVGAIAISDSSTKQRLGDRWGKTVVILSGTERAIPPPMPPLAAETGPPGSPGTPPSDGPPIPPPPASLAPATSDRRAR